MFTTAVRTILVILNVLIFAGGAGLVAIGLLLRFDTGYLGGDALDLLNNIQYKNMPIGVALEAMAYTSIAFGVIIMIVALFGICGGWKEIKGCMYCYLSAVIFVLLMEATLVGIWIAIRGRNNEWLRGSLLAQLKDYVGPEAPDKLSQGWNEFFMEAQCCGVNAQYADGGTNNDFIELPTTWTTDANNLVPATCCQGVDSDTVSDYVDSAHCTTDPSNFYTDGCYDAMQHDLNIYSIVTIAICAAIMLAEVIAFVASCVAISKTGRSRVSPMGTPSGSESRPPPYVAIEKWMRQKNMRKNIDSGYH